MVQISIDVETNNVSCGNGTTHFANGTFSLEHSPPTVEGYFEAFGTIMFAFGGASTFPTIQADMKDKSKFKFAAYIAMAGTHHLTLCKIINNNFSM